MKKYGLVLLIYHYGSVFCLCSACPVTRSGRCSPACPHSFVPNTGWTGGQFDVSQNDKSQFNLWLNYSKEQHGTCIKDGSDKEQADPFHTEQINLKS